MNDQPFSRGVGRILDSGPYRQHSDVDPDELFTLCEQWLSNVEQDKSS